jgi:hypothetical protein
LPANDKNDSFVQLIQLIVKISYRVDSKEEQIKIILKNGKRGIGKIG